MLTPIDLIVYWGYKYLKFFRLGWLYHERIYKHGIKRKD